MLNNGGLFIEYYYVFGEGRGKKRPKSCVHTKWMTPYGKPAKTSGLDFQMCRFRVGSYGHNDKSIEFYTRATQYTHGSEEQATGLNYKVVAIHPLSKPFYASSTFGNFSLAGFEIELQRHSWQYILDFYLPTTFFVSVSWVSPFDKT